MLNFNRIKQINAAILKLYIYYDKIFGNRKTEKSFAGKINKSINISNKHTIGNYFLVTNYMYTRNKA